MHVRCDNQYKTGAGRGNILGQPMLFECMGICVLSLAHESEMRGYLIYVLIVQYLLHRFCLNSATVYKIGQPYRGIFWGFFKTFLEGSVDRVIYRDNIVNRRFFIYCSLAGGDVVRGQAYTWLAGVWSWNTCRECDRQSGASLILTRLC